MVPLLLERSGAEIAQRRMSPPADHIKRAFQRLKLIPVQEWNAQFRGPPDNGALFKTENLATLLLPAVPDEPAITATEVQPPRCLIQADQGLNRLQDSAPFIDPDGLFRVFQFKDVVYPWVRSTTAK